MNTETNPNPSFFCDARHLCNESDPPVSDDDRMMYRPDLGRFAIADGARQSYNPGPWAELLVKGFVDSRLKPREIPCALLTDLQRRWQENVMAELEGVTLEYFSRNKLEHGSFSTFLGFYVESPMVGHANRWEALALGDSCLFHVREGNLKFAWPLDHPDQFGFNPRLVGSRVRARSLFSRNRNGYRRGTWLPGDQFWMMTDALAKWFLGEFHTGNRPWDLLETLMRSAPEQFETWVRLLRDRDEIHNDDTTCLLVIP